MKPQSLLKSFLLLLLLAGFLFPPASAQVVQAAPVSKPAAEVTAFDLIIAMNSLRASYGLPPLVEDPIIDAVAQSTAQIMADSQMSWHIGDVSGRLTAAGYGGGSKVWATENFAVGNQSIDEIMLVWSDAAHMLPAVTAAYCNVGAGTAKSANGMTYYILQAAYPAGKSCGDYSSSGTTTTQSGGTTNSGAGVPQLITPIKIATPDADGKIFHLVQSGQSFWAIAIAYKITIKDLKSWNNLSQDAILKTGQKLFIPGSNTAGYASPTQTGGIQLGAADAEGKIVHVVQPYQTLSTIAQAYGTSVEKLLALNSLQVDWPLRIGQELIITPSNTTPSPTLQPVQLLTPASDGKYYHTVRSGETLSWIARLYGVTVSNLMAWNGLSQASIIQPEQKLILQVTPPATVTSTALPPTATPLVFTSTPTQFPTSDLATQTPTAATPAAGQAPLLWGGIFLLAAGLGLGAFIYRRKKQGV